MNVYEKIGKIEAIGLILIIMISHIILNIPDSILRTTGSSAILNTIYISLIAFIFSCIIVKLFKPFDNSDILDISKYLGGNFLKTIIGIIYIIFFLFISGTLLRYFASSLKLIYFQNSPLIFLLLLFLIPVCITNKISFKSISQINLMFIPISLISLIIILLSTVNHLIPQRALPILGYGFNKTFLVGATNLFAFGGIAYLYFLPPMLKDYKDFKSIVKISIVVSSFLLLISVICLLMLFSYVSQSDELLSFLLITRLIQYGRFFQRVDAILIFFWIISILLYLSITLYFILYIFKKITKIKNSSQLAFSFTSLMFGIALIVGNIAVIKFLEQKFYKYMMLVVVFGISFIVLLLANLKLKKH